MKQYSFKKVFFLVMLFCSIARGSFGMLEFFEKKERELEKERKTATIKLTYQLVIAALFEKIEPVPLPLTEENNAHYTKLLIHIEDDLKKLIPSFLHAFRWHIYCIFHFIKYPKVDVFNTLVDLEKPFERTDLYVSNMITKMNQYQMNPHACAA